MGRYELQLDSHDLLFGLNYGDGKMTGGNYRNKNGEKNGETTSVERKAQNLEAFAIDRWQLAAQWTLDAMKGAVLEIGTHTLYSRAHRK